MASNVGTWFLRRYQEGEELAHRGATAEALDICWELLGDPRISLYVRALVNQLVGSIIDVEQHRDALKYPQAVVASLDKMKEELPDGYKKDQEVLEEMRESAHKNAHAIARQLALLATHL
jgi:hypothetical protein